MDTSNDNRNYCRKRGKYSVKNIAMMFSKNKREKPPRSSRRSHTPEESAKALILRRSVFYTICLFAVYQLMLIPLQSSNYPLFWIASGIGIVLVIAELLYSRTHQSRSAIHFELPHLTKPRGREHLLHHILIPILLYTSGTLFLFFNRVRALDQVAIVLLSFTFFVILYNISASTLKIYVIERKTRTLYDFVNIIVFYFITDVLINLMMYYGLSQWFVFGGTIAATFILIGLMILITRQYSLEIFAMLLLTAFIMGVIVFSLWQVPLFNIAVISIVATVAFYLFDVYWHHQLEGSFTWDAMSQYVLFAIMAVILLLYI